MMYTNKFEYSKIIRLDEKYRDQQKQLYGCFLPSGTQPLRKVSSKHARMAVHNPKAETYVTENQKFKNFLPEGKD